MSRREVLIILAHALDCGLCRAKLLADPTSVFAGRALTPDEKDTLSELGSKDFVTEMLLARSVGATLDELHSFRDHPVARLRHF